MKYLGILISLFTLNFFVSCGETTAYDNCLKQCSNNTKICYAAASTMKEPTLGYLICWLVQPTCENSCGSSNKSGSTTRRTTSSSSRSSSGGSSSSSGSGGGGGGHGGGAGEIDFESLK